MTITLTKEQIRIKTAAVEFAKNELNQTIRDNDKQGRFNLSGWEKSAEYGLLGLSVPEEYGGLGLDLLTCVVIMEALGSACEDSGLLFAINSQIWTCESPLLKFGTKSQKERYLPGLVKGTLIGGHAMTEPDAGSDAFGMTCEASRKGDTYILNGSKIFITNAPMADLLIIFAVTDKKKGFGSMSAFLVEKDFPGISFGKQLDMTGLRTCPIGEVFLQECAVPAENMLGKEGMGSAIFNSEMEEERCCLFATHLGAMENVMKHCIDHARNRHQFGTPIGQNQAISHKISDMRVRTELSRLILHHVAGIKNRGERAYLESAIAKLYISEGYVQTCLDAIQIHGAYGCCNEFGFERKLRDSVMGKIYSGTSEIQKNIIARFMNL